MRFCQLAICSLILIDAVIAYPLFRERIPNGYSVPNPDIPGSVWSGAGHLAVGGGGPRNPFGLDFATNGFQWTVELCQMDSDRDNRTNGEELGDPNCIWTEGDDPEFPAQSNPGVVDKATEAPNSDTCEKYDPPSDTQTFDIKFNAPNNLDGSRTEYICEQFRENTPDRSTLYFHQIKSEPLVDNEDVLHHIWIYSCDGTTSSDGNRVGQGSYSCSGIEGNCQIVAGWALGMPEICEPPNVGAGLVFGSANGEGVFKVEAHYDNANGQVTTDQSGMRLHITKELRPLEAGQIIVGMDYWDRQFELEPGRSLVSRSNICPSQATMQLPHPIYIYSWNPHMHLHGKSLVTEHYRCGEKIGEIGSIPNFEFDNQQSYVLETPVKVLPGDSLVTTCGYDTSNAVNPIIGGEQTTEEMCDNYLSYYPSVWTEEQPNLFTACVAFERGVRPDLVGYNDFSSFVTLDLGGETFLEGHDPNPANNLAPCCTNGGVVACEEEYLAAINQPCGSDVDCTESLICNGGFCMEGAPSASDSDDTKNPNTGSSGGTGNLPEEDVQEPGVDATGTLDGEAPESSAFHTVAMVTIQMTVVTGLSFSMFI